MDNNFEFKVGMTVGLKDIVDQESPNMVEWYTILAIELDDEYPIAWLYLKSDTEKRNDKESQYGKYAEIIESLSERFVLP